MRIFAHASLVGSIQPKKQKEKTVNPIVSFNSVSAMAEFIRSNGTQCRFVSLLSETEPKLRKDCPFKGVRKVSRKVGLINVNYVSACEKGIAALLGADAGSVDYAPGETWYRHEETQDGKRLPLCVHKTDSSKGFYLQFYPRASVNTYVDGAGNAIEEESLAPYFYSRGEKPEFKPAVIVVSLANLRELRASGIIAQSGDVESAEKALA